MEEARGESDVTPEPQISRIAIVTCQQFADLTGDDRILYKALRTYLADQFAQDDMLKDEGGEEKQSESGSSKVKEEDTKGKVRLEIVIWDNPSIDWSVYSFCILRSPWVRLYTASPLALKLTTLRITHKSMISS